MRGGDLGMGVRLRREGRGKGRGSIVGMCQGRKFLESLSNQFSPKGGRPRTEDEATYLSAPPSPSPALRSRSSRLPRAPLLHRFSASRRASRLPREESAAAAAARRPPPAARGPLPSCLRSGLLHRLCPVPPHPFTAALCHQPALPTPLLGKFVSLG